MTTTTNRTVSLPLDHLSSLGEELGQIAKALSRVSEKLKKIPTVSTVRVTPQTDPEMFTEEFLGTVRKSREDIKHGRVMPYEQVREKLGL